MSYLRRSILLSAAVLILSASSAFAYPFYLEAYRADPFRRPTIDDCSACHASALGGDARNPFGLAFAAAQFQITPMIRAQFPDRFVYPVSRTGDLTIHFSDPSNVQMVVESGDRRTLVDVAAKTVNGTPAAAGDASVAAAPPAAPSSTTPQALTDVPVDIYAREGAFFGMQLVNLPNGKPVPAGGVDFMISHRFLRSVCWDDCVGSEAGPSDLFGLDGPAFINFAARVGLSDRFSLGAGRSNRRRTIEFTSMLNIVRQGETGPTTLSLRAGIEGQNNFRQRYSPYIQPILVQTFGDRVSFALVPTFAFNTRDDETILPPEVVFGEEHNHTIALGVGLGIRFLETTSLVGEYIPRLWGFKGEFKDRPGVSIGLEKSTFRHTFELILSRQEPMTTSQYAVQGTDTFRLGFNIYRRIR